jgi:hypothetical protein
MNDTQEQERVAVITGASFGIGAATAHALAADGYWVALLARPVDRITALADELGNGAIAIEADVIDRDALRLRACSEPVAAGNCSNKRARPGGSGCAFSRLARHKWRSTRPAPPLCKQWSHSIRANSNSDLSRAQFVPNTPPTAVTHGSPWSALSFGCKEPPSQRASGFVLQAGHANSIRVVALRPPGVASRLRYLTVASPRPVERSGGAACPSAPATAPRSPR